MFLKEKLKKEKRKRKKKGNCRPTQVWLIKPESQVPTVDADRSWVSKATPFYRIVGDSFLTRSTSFNCFLPCENERTNEENNTLLTDNAILAITTIAKRKRDFKNNHIHNHMAGSTPTDSVSVDMESMSSSPKVSAFSIIIFFFSLVIIFFIYFLFLTVFVLLILSFFSF